MSFLDDLRAELCALPLDRRCCARAELSAFFMGAASITYGGFQRKLVFHTPYSAVARRVFSLLKFEPKVLAAPSSHVTPAFGGRRQYRLTLSAHDTDPVFSSLALNLSGRVDPAILRRACCRRALCRGFFLSCGTMINPDAGYLSEFVLPHASLARAVKTALKTAGITSTLRQRAGSFVLSIQRGEDLSDLLSFLNAPSATLAFEEKRLKRDLRGRVNRQTNCDAGNLSRQLAAGEAQAQAIEKLSKQGKLSGLSDPMFRLCALRLQNPDYTLAQLGALCLPPVSKTTVSRRMAAILAMAEKDA